SIKSSTYINKILGGRALPVNLKALLLLSLVALTPSLLACDQQIPTASEVFHLRDECNVLGEKLLKGVTDSPVKSQISHYNPRMNRCYVLLTTQLVEGVHDIHHKWLYDGQDPRKFIVLVTVGNGQKFASSERGTPETFDSGCAYIDKLMEAKNSCAELETWFV